MTVFYSTRFQPQFDQLPPTLQEQFKLIDNLVKREGVNVLRPNGWIYSKAIGSGFIAWGSCPEENVFLWRGVGLANSVPIIL